MIAGEGFAAGAWVVELGEVVEGFEYADSDGFVEVFEPLACSWGQLKGPGRIHWLPR